MSPDASCAPRKACWVPDAMSLPWPEPRDAIMAASGSPSNGFALRPCAPRDALAVTAVMLPSATGCLPCALSESTPASSILASPSESFDAPSSRAVSFEKLYFSAIRPCLASSACSFSACCCLSVASDSSSTMRWALLEMSALSCSFSCIVLPSVSLASAWTEASSRSLLNLALATWHACARWSCGAISFFCAISSAHVPRGAMFATTSASWPSGKNSLKNHLAESSKLLTLTRSRSS